MKRLFINLPFLALFFCSAYWPENNWLNSLALAAALLMMMCAILIGLYAVACSEQQLKAFTAQTYKGQTDRYVGRTYAGLLAIGMAAAGFPVIAAVHAVFCLIHVAAVISAEKE